jgi:hypothetical protein
LVADQILQHARAGRAAFIKNRLIDARYHVQVCGWLLWRLGVDGLTEDGQLRWDGAKFETRLPGRWATADARRLRESPAFARRAPSALVNHLACDHILPRNCVAETLVRPDWWDLDDDVGGRAFVTSHAEVAILSAEEDTRLKDAGWESRMPEEWWDAGLEQKSAYLFARYGSVQPRIEVDRTAGPAADEEGVGAG